MDSHLLDRFKRDMTDMLRRLRAQAAQILWRSYSPSHFGGEQGSFILDKKDQGREQQDKVSTVSRCHKCVIAVDRVAQVPKLLHTGKYECTGKAQDQAATVSEPDVVQPVCAR